MRDKMPNPKWGAMRIVGLYLLFGFLWILFSDQLVDLFVTDQDIYQQVSTYKGWGYVLITGILLYVLIKNHTDRLSTGQAWLQMAYDAADLGAWQHDHATGIFRFDERTRVHHGFDKGVYEMPFTEVLAHVHPDDLALLEKGIAKATDPAFNGYYSSEFRTIHRDGSIHWLEVDAHVSFEGVGEKRRPVLGVGTSRDITASKKADLQIHYFARLYAALSQINQTIVRCNDRQELFDSICKVAVEFGEFRLAWIGLLDEETGSLISTAEYGFGEKKFPFQKINTWKKPFRDGLSGLALRSGRVEICNDIQVDAHMAHWREIALQDNYHSAAAVPIRENTRVIGLLILLAEDSDFFMVLEEQKLLEELGMDISFALDNMQVEKQREHAVKELMEAEERFQKAFYSGPVGLAITRASDGVYIDVNPAFSDLIGFSRDELVGETSLGLNITTPAQRQEYVNAMVKEGAIRDQEMVLRSKSGETLVVLGSMEVIELNRETCVLSTTIDITRRRGMEEELREIEQRFRQIAENIEEVFWIFDPVEKKEVYISPAFEKIWMRSIQSFVEKPDLFFESILPEDRSYVREVTGRQSRGEKTEMQYRISRPDGSIRWIWDHGFPIFDEQGKVIRVVAILADISERKKAELDLVELNQNLEQRVNARTAEVQDLYENAPAGYHSLDVNGLIVRMNQTELDWLGYTREEVIGVKYITDLYTPESRKIFFETYPHHKEAGWVKDLELEVVRKDGSIIPVLLNGTAIYNEQGEFVMSRSTFFDITERKQAELKLQAANIELEKAAKLKDEFLANMSHELRTPLNAIIGLSESLDIGTYGELAPRQKATLSVIQESGRHLLELINDILDLSKIEADMLELQYETINLKDICEASLLMVREHARRKELQISISITDEIQTIQADPRRLKQMIVNLLSNAVKFTPLSGKISLEVVPQNDHAVCFTVRDTGIGIAAEHLEGLFKPFIQVDSSLSRKYEGTGLGLALVRQLAEMHGGSVGVESAPEAGSSFYFIIPRQSSMNFIGEEASSAHREIMPESASLPSAFITILVVEDNPTNLMFTSDYLEKKGFNIITAENGLQAIQQTEIHKPDLILMDIQMPEMDGLEAIRRLRSAPEFDTVPIIALTALAMPGDRERCLTAGASDYLAKPVSLKKLVEVITSLLK